ncbi:hypothetical protein Sjap_013193 [Stephania japonica]|uniref:CCHC-type domain-containing protein n=1 Tax=Stephania japonica TaxID=461633 RepID=A0AAP0IXG9_9MAGN
MLFAASHGNMIPVAKVVFTCLTEEWHSNDRIGWDREWSGLTAGQEPNGNVRDMTEIVGVITRTVDPDIRIDSGIDSIEVMTETAGHMQYHHHSSNTLRTRVVEIKIRGIGVGIKYLGPPSGGSERRRCYSCGQRGHISVDCRRASLAPEIPQTDERVYVVTQPVREITRQHEQVFHLFTCLEVNRDGHGTELSRLDCSACTGRSRFAVNTSLGNLLTGLVVVCVGQLRADHGTSKS